MRTDVTVRTKGKERVPQIPFPSAGRQAWVERGDWVEWNIERHTHRGRVIGFVVNPEDGKTYIVVVLLMLGGCCSERWVLPEDVIDARRNGDCFKEKMQWLFGSDFMDTEPDKARRCFELTMAEMK